jgi:3-carboxy-cis,cis-muconate cycloisomerase
MPAAPADSALYRGLFSDDEVQTLFSDSAELRAMLLVEGALARVQGKLGLIPADAAAYIDRASREVSIDPSALSAATATNGVPVPAFLAAFRKDAGAPEPMQFVHWGATSQDIMDTALMLRLKRLHGSWAARLDGLIATLRGLAETHAATPMAGRSYGQIATPTSFGAVVAEWGRPLLEKRQALENIKFPVSLSGAIGTLSAMGEHGPQVRADLAEALGLTDPGHSWHSDRSPLIAFSNWMTELSTSLGKIGADLILMTQSGIAEITIEGAGASSTMPQKQNPVGPSVLVALARQCVALNGLMQGATLHQQQRDGAAWFTEWLSLPQLCTSTGRALALTADLATRITPNTKAMAQNMDDGTGLIHAEAYSFLLTQKLPREAAQAAIKTLCREARETGASLAALVERDHGLSLPAASLLGQAPADARAFAKSAKG